MNELKPCPFCGSDAVKVLGREESGYTVFCLNCYVEGPPDLGVSGAIKAWNTRPIEDELRIAKDQGWDSFARAVDELAELRALKGSE